MKGNKRLIKNTSIREFFKKDGILSKGNPNYKERPEQLKAAEKLELALENDKHFILEGPCGFGKSLTYLIPSIKQIYKSKSKEKIVIVTSNISLQEQLILKDLPFVVNQFKKVQRNSNIRYAALKGISNFACKCKIEQLLNDSSLIDSDEKKEDQARIEKFYTETKTGDLNDIDFNMTKSLRKLISCSDSNECEQQDCAENIKSECYYALQKKTAKNADIVVTNYHMLYSMSEVNSDTLSEASIYVFDEVHEAEEILRELKSTEVKPGSFDYIKKQISAMINKATIDASENFEHVNIDAIKQYANTFFENIYIKDKESIRLIKMQSDLPDADNLKVQLKILIKAIAMFKEQLESDSKIKKENADAINMARKLKKTCYKIYDVTCNVDKVLEDENKVIWTENKNGTIILGFKDVDVSQEFYKMYLNFKGVRAILTSATISSDGNFEYLKNSLGLNYLDSDRVYEFLGKTPFDLQNQELWYLPDDAAPGNHPVFQEKMLEQICNLVKATNGGALVLFTSNKNMEICKEYLLKEIPDFKILTQGDMSKRKILDEFKNDKDSTLLATKSFFTGVDIQGSSLRCVIIDKLPFTSPNDPVTQKLNERQGAFWKYSLPSMIITLKQAVGRGVRTVEDKCVICILDNRIATAKYKDKIFRSLKYKKTSTRNLIDVQNFMKKNGYI